MKVFHITGLAVIDFIPMKCLTPKYQFSQTAFSGLFTGLFVVIIGLVVIIVDCFDTESS